MNTKSAWQTFLFLIFGFLILFISASFFYNAYWRINHNNLTPELLAKNIVHFVNIATFIPPKQLPKAAKIIRHPGISVSFAPANAVNPTTFTNNTVKDVYQQILQDPNNVRLNFALDNQIVMRIHAHIFRSLTVKIQFMCALLVWIMALIGFCYYIVRRLSMPLAYFIEGANRFSQDLNAPPIPEIGPRSTRSAFKAFNRMQANYKQLLQDRTQMLAAISHDLKTPITRLKLRLENLTTTATTEKMQRDLDQMQTMIDSILTFAREDYQHEAVSQIDVNALVQTICDDMQDANQPLQYQESDKRMISVGRPTALRRAIENIINNGIKYGESVHIDLSLQNNFAVLNIKDQGPGLADNELEKVFLPFYRVDKARNSENAGSGLGLATARDIIRSHGGEINLKNMTPNGLLASIKLPTSNL